VRLRCVRRLGRSGNSSLVLILRVDIFLQRVLSNLICCTNYLPSYVFLCGQIV